MDKIKISLVVLTAAISELCFAGAMGSSQSNSWTGLYIGGQIGESWEYSDLRQETLVGTRLGSTRIYNSSFLGGGYVGLNLQMKDFLIGVEGDANGVNLSNYNTCLYQSDGVGNPSPGACFTPAYNFDNQMAWQAAARGRLGWIWLETLFYVAGGVTFSDVKSTFNTVDNYAPVGSETIHTNYVGSTAGVGVEYKFNGHWVARAEYRYDNYGTGKKLITQGGGFWNQTIVSNYIKDNSFRVGLSYLI